MVPEKRNNNFTWAIFLSLFIHIVLWLMKNGDVDRMGLDQIEQAVIHIVKTEFQKVLIALLFILDGVILVSLCSKYLGRIKHTLPM